jgi:hypothetical protein
MRMAVGIRMTQPYALMTGKRRARLLLRSVLALAAPWMIRPLVVTFSCAANEKSAINR